MSVDITQGNITSPENNIFGREYDVNSQLTSNTYFPKIIHVNEITKVNTSLPQSIVANAPHFTVTQKVRSRNSSLQKKIKKKPIKENKRNEHNKIDLTALPTIVNLEKKECKANFDVYIGHSFVNDSWNIEGSIWENPFTRKCTSYSSLDKYERHIRNSQYLIDKLDELKGKKLGCWCRKSYSIGCHATVLIKILREKMIKESNQRKLFLKIASEM